MLEGRYPMNWVLGAISPAHIVRCVFFVSIVHVVFSFFVVLVGLRTWRSAPDQRRPDPKDTRGDILLRSIQPRG